MVFAENNERGFVKRGSVEVITGSMFSGKTEELIRRLRRAQFAGQKLAIFKPSIDNRYSEVKVVSHDEKSVLSTPVDNAAAIMLMVGDAEVIGIDEAQFFDDALVEVCESLADAGKRVIVAGLDMDFAKKPFGPMPGLMAIAEDVTKVHAICVRCGNLAQYSFRKKGGDKVVELGEKDKYEPLCRECYNKAIVRKG